MVKVPYTMQQGQHKLSYQDESVLGQGYYYTEVHVAVDWRERQEEMMHALLVKHQLRFHSSSEILASI